jgi:hypothetical protein
LRQKSFVSEKEVSRPSSLFIKGKNKYIKRKLEFTKIRTHGASVAKVTAYQPSAATPLALNLKVNALIAR